MPTMTDEQIGNRMDWKVSIEGVKNPRTFTLAQLQKLGHETMATILQCSGNGRGFFKHKPRGSQWKTGAAACVLWTGVPMKTVVDACGGINGDAVFMTSAGVDHQPTGLDPKKAMIERSVPKKVFDSWAGILTAEQYTEFGMKYVSRICDAINEVPVTVFSKGAYFALNEMKNLKCNTIGLDWNMNIEQAIKTFGNSKTLQGNLDPCVLYSDFNSITKITKEMLNRFANTRHIANLGHGVYPDINPENVKCFIEAVKSHKLN